MAGGRCCLGEGGWVEPTRDGFGSAESGGGETQRTGLWTMIRVGGRTILGAESPAGGWARAGSNFLSTEAARKPRLNTCGGG